MSASNGRARTENRRRAILARDGDLCWICEEPLGDDMTIEHVVERAEGGRNALSSLLIKEAVAMTLDYWKTIPLDGFITFVDPTKVKPKQHPGYTYLKAGFEAVGETQGGLVVLQFSREKLKKICPREVRNLL